MEMVKHWYQRSSGNSIDRQLCGVKGGLRSIVFIVWRRIWTSAQVQFLMKCYNAAQYKTSGSNFNLPRLFWGCRASENDHDVLPLHQMHGSIVKCCHCSFPQRRVSHKAPAPVTMVNTAYTADQPLQRWASVWWHGQECELKGQTRTNMFGPGLMNVAFLNVCLGGYHIYFRRETFATANVMWKPWSEAGTDGEISHASWQGFLKHTRQPNLSLPCMPAVEFSVELTL